MKRRTTVQWKALFAEHERSGLSAAAFCRERGLDAKYFCLRRKQLDTGNGRERTLAFVPVTAPSASPAVVIEIARGGDVQLRVPTAVSARWLGELLHQLRA